VLGAFDTTANEPQSEADRDWSVAARAMVTTMLYAWLRRGELLGLPWYDVELAAVCEPQHRLARHAQVLG
jgi:hypothetical protein